MRSEHVFLTILLLLAVIVYLISKGAAGINPPPDDEPYTEQPPLPFAETAHVDHIGEFIQRANAS